MASKVSGLIEKIDIGGTPHAIVSTAYGYCETVANEPIKQVDMTGFKLEEGVTIHVKFANANSADNPKLKFNSEADTNAKPIVQYGTTAAGTTSSTNGWYSGAVLTLTYDGTSWVRDQGFNTNSTYYYESCYSETGSATAAKVGITSSYVLPTIAGHFAFWLKNSNTVQGKITLAIKNGNTAGTAKDIWIDGAVTSSTNYTWPAGFYIGYYDGSVYHFRTDGKLPGSITGDADGNAATATTATNLANNPSIQTSGTTQITITAGGKTSSAYTVPYATSAGSATSATTATYIKCTDTRNTALNPTDLTAAKGVRFDFKAKGTINLTATDAYAGVMSFRPYASSSDWSGGNAHQLAFNSEGLHWRNGGTSWGNWYQILDSNNTSSGTNNAATLTWNTTYTIAKINGTDIKFTTMAKPTYAFTDLTSHPTTLSGYGITDAMSSSTIVTNVSYTSVTDNAEYPILIKNSTGSTTTAGGVKFNSDVTINPSTCAITATLFKGKLNTNHINQTALVGTREMAGGDKGASANPRYLPEKWKFNANITVTDGDIITIKTPGAGHDYGTYLSLDNGANYYPIVLNTNGRYTTHFSTGTAITLRFDSSGSAASMFTLNGQNNTTRVTVSGGVWRLLTVYDSGNTNDTAVMNIRIGSANYKTTTKYQRYVLSLIKNDTHIIPLNTDKNNSNNDGTTANSHTLTTDTFDITSYIFVYNTNNSSYAADAAISASGLWYGYSGIDMRYSFNITTSTFTAHKNVYIKASLQSATTAKLCTEGNPVTQTLPSTKDNYIYILIGRAYNGYCITLFDQHPIYYYDGTTIREFSPINTIGAAKGDLMYWSAANIPTRLALGTSGYFLQATANGPTWAQTLGIANGGTGNTSFTKDCVIVSDGATTPKLESRGLKVTGATNAAVTVTVNNTNSGLTISPNGTGTMTLSSTTGATTMSTTNGALTVKSTGTGAVALQATSSGNVAVSSTTGTMTVSSTNGNMTIGPTGTGTNTIKTNSGALTISTTSGDMSLSSGGTVDISSGTSKAVSISAGSTVSISSTTTSLLSATTTMTVSGTTGTTINAGSNYTIAFKINNTEKGEFNKNGMFQLNDTGTQSTHKLYVNGNSAFNGKIAIGEQSNNSIIENVYMQWNSTDQSLDFVFA